MKIIFVDDEPSAHVNFRHNIELRKDIESLHCFLTADEALLHAANNPIDCAFMDISLCGTMNGLDLAKELKSLHPHIEVAFLTAFEEYTKPSYQLGGRAYLMKPYSEKELDDALDLMKRLVCSLPATQEQVSDVKTHIKIRTFGYFDLIVDGRAVTFKTAKVKEALAFLVDQMGGSVNGAQIFFALWERQEYNATTSIYVRRTMRALKETLMSIGISDILVFGRNCYSIDMTQLYCDSYALIHGNIEEANLFNEEYMKQYSWAEVTIPLLARAAKKLTCT